MRVLGIDPGTSCGWALLSDGDRIASGRWDLQPGPADGKGVRYLRLQRHLDAVLANPPDVVHYEDVRRHLGTQAAHVYGGIVAVILAACEARGIPYRGIPVQTAKIAATGRGKADKADMIDAAEARWGYRPRSSDEADALWIASVQ